MNVGAGFPHISLYYIAISSFSMVTRFRILKVCIIIQSWTMSWHCFFYFSVFLQLTIAFCLVFLIFREYLTNPDFALFSSCLYLHLLNTVSLDIIFNDNFLIRDWLQSYHPRLSLSLMLEIPFPFGCPVTGYPLFLCYYIVVYHIK